MLKIAATLLATLALADASLGQASHVDLEDADLDVPELVRKYGYPLEVHDVVTQDGYILQMHRIPYGRGNSYPNRRPIVYLQHGLISSSADWVIMGPGRSLAYILAEEGFDVWMGNARGNYYSRRHVSDNPERSGFWNFSWDEIGQIDLAANIDHILRLTGSDALHYIGHSQGTTTFLVLTSLKPEYNAKFKTVHLMAPVAFMDHFNSPGLTNLASYTYTLANVGTVLGLYELFPRGSTFEFVEGELRCVQSNPLSSYCEQLIPAFTGQDMEQFQKDMLPVIFGHTPAGSSLKQFAHYGQVINTHRFRRWNYILPLQNRLAYGSFSAPAYDLSRVTARVKLHYSLADNLTPEPDVIGLSKALPSSTLRKIPLDTFTHFDFAWASAAKDLVYNDIISTMFEYERE